MKPLMNREDLKKLMMLFRHLFMVVGLNIILISGFFYLTPKVALQHQANHSYDYLYPLKTDLWSMNSEPVLLAYEGYEKPGNPSVQHAEPEWNVYPRGSKHPEKGDERDQVQTGLSRALDNSVKNFRKGIQNLF